MTDLLFVMLVLSGLTLVVVGAFMAYPPVAVILSGVAALRLARAVVEMGEDKV